MRYHCTTEMTFSVARDERQGCVGSKFPSFIITPTGSPTLKRSDAIGNTSLAAINYVFYPGDQPHDTAPAPRHDRLPNLF